MFEDLNVRNLNLTTDAVLSGFTFGRLTYTVVDVGAGVAHVTPTYGQNADAEVCRLVDNECAEGYVMPHAVQQSKLAGHALDLYMNHLLQQSPELSAFGNLQAAKLIKEHRITLSDVRPGRTQDSTSPNVQYPSAKLPDGVPGRSLKLPDGREVPISSQLLDCSTRVDDLVFEPAIWDMAASNSSLQAMVEKCIQLCDIDILKDEWSNICLTGVHCDYACPHELMIMGLVGGTSGLPYFAKRLRESLAPLAPPGTIVKVSTLHVYLG